jgi:hypothetical protein
VRVELAEARRPDSAARPRVLVRGRRVPVRDGAAPVLVRASTAPADGTHRVSVRVSEPVRPGRLQVHGPGGDDLPARVLAPAAGPQLQVRVTGAVAPAVVVSAPAGAPRDAAGNRTQGAVPAVPAPAPVAASPAPPAPADATPLPDLPARPAVQAAAFRDTVGVNTHLYWMGSAYDDFPRVRQRILDLGVRHIRDGACPTCAWYEPRVLDLGRAGVRTTLLLVDQRKPVAPDLALARRLRPALAALEGANEPDQSGDPSWVANTRAHQRDLHAQAGADPALSGLPVLGPSLVHRASYAALGDLRGALDQGNIHPYAGGDVPGARIAEEGALARAVSGDRPAVVTEAGYHTALRTTSGHLPASEQAVAAYLPRMYLEHFRRGVPRTFAYQLADHAPADDGRDPELHFGLLRHDLSPKPAYTALRDLLRALGDGGAAGSLRFRLDGPDDLRHVLLRQADGDLALALWRDVSVWDRTARREREVAPADVAVTLGERVASARVTRPGAGGAGAATYDQPRSLALPIGAMPVVVELSR